MLVLLPNAPGVQINIAGAIILGVIAAGLYLLDSYQSTQKIQQSNETIRKLKEGELKLDQIQAREGGLTVEDEAGNTVQLA